MQGPYAVTEAAVALAGASATAYSGGTTVGALNGSSVVYAPAGRLGLSVVVSGYSAGNVDFVVQTAASEADADGEWLDTDTRINGVAANGTYQIEVVSPIMDKVRLSIEVNTEIAATATLTATPSWVSDVPLDVI